MYIRKYAFGCEKFQKKKKKKVEKLIEYHKGSLNKFVISNKKNMNDNFSEKLINEQKI